MQITKTTLEQFRIDFAQAVKTLESQYKVSIGLGSISYNETQFTTRVTVNNKEHLSIGTSNEQVDFIVGINSSFNTKLKAEHYGVVVTLQRTQYKIVGYKPSSRRYPVIVERISDGKKFKWVESEILSAITTTTKPITVTTTNDTDVVTQNSTLTLKVSTSKGMISKHDDKTSRTDQVKYYMNEGLTSASEIAGLLGTNASYVNRLMK